MDGKCNDGLMRAYYPHNIRGEISIDEGCSLNPSVYLDNTGDITIGKGTCISPDVMIYTHEHDHSRNTPIAESGIEVHGIVIGGDVFIGARSIILAGTGNIGTGAVIGAGAVVTKPVGEYEIWAGNPAQKIGIRKNNETQDNLHNARS